MHSVIRGLFRLIGFTVLWWLTLSLQFLFKVLGYYDLANGVADAEIGLEVYVERELKALIPDRLQKSVRDYAEVVVFGRY